MKEWTLARKGYTRKLPYYEVHHNGVYHRFSGKTKAINYARSISNNIFNPNRTRIDIVNTQSGEVTKFQ